MKRSKMFWSFAGILLAVVALPSFGGGRQSSDQPVTLTLWAGNSLIGANEWTMPQSEWFVTKSVERFKAKHPNVNVNVVPYADGNDDQVFANFKAAALAGTGVDVSIFLNGPALISIKDALLELTPYISAEDRKNLAGWETTAVDMDPGKSIYGLPFGGQSMTGFAYNRSLVSKAGFDFDNNPPRSVQEFYAALDKIKAAGILPYVSDEEFPLLVLLNTTLWWVQQTGYPGLLAHNTGTTKYADDKGFLSMLEEYQKFYKNGWINRDAATSSNAAQIFMQGGAALKSFHSGDIDEFRSALGDNLGIMPTPSWLASETRKNTTIGGVGAAVGVANFSKNKDLAVELARHLVSREEQIEFYKAFFMIPSRLDVTAADIGRSNDPYFNKLVSWAQDVYFWPDNCIDAKYLDIYYSMTSQVLIGNMTPQEFAVRMDQAFVD
jgi:ABC-type glycerol-3-phosphate transport system substrate-binding protein